MRNFRFILVAMSALVFGMPLQAVETGSGDVRPVSNKTYTNFRDKDSGFWWTVEAYGGYSVEMGDNYENTGFAELDVAGGYRFNEYFRIGLGLGGRYYFDSEKIRSNKANGSFPVYVTVRGNMMQAYERRVVPYYAFSLGGAVHDGVMFRPTIGIRVGDTARSAFVLGLSYLGQSVQLPRAVRLKVHDRRHVQSFVCLSVGYEF